MKVTVAEADIARAGVQQIQVGEIKVGPVEINKLVLSDVHVQTSTGIAQMRNVRLTLTLKFELDWEVSINISSASGGDNGGGGQAIPSRQGGALHSEPVRRTRPTLCHHRCQLVFFSTESEDAWMLDPSDRLAARLARDGDPKPIESPVASLQSWATLLPNLPDWAS